MDIKTIAAIVTAAIGAVGGAGLYVDRPALMSDVKEVEEKAERGDKNLRIIMIKLDRDRIARELAALEDVIETEGSTKTRGNLRIHLQSEINRATARVEELGKE